MTAWVAMLSVIVCLEALMIVGLLRSHGEMLRRLHALDGGGDPADATTTNATPVDFSVRADLPAPGEGAAGVHDLSGAGIRDDVVLVGVRDVPHRTLIAFLSSSCLTCRTFWDAFASRAGLGLADDVRVVIVTKDPAEESVSTLRDLAATNVPLVMSSQAWSDYAVPGSPYFVFVDGAHSAVIGEGTGASWAQVANLLSTAAADADDARQRASRSGRRDPSRDGVGNESRVDRELLAAGIGPGDPSLFPAAAPPDLPPTATPGRPA